MLSYQDYKEEQNHIDIGPKRSSCANLEIQQLLICKPQHPLCWPLFPLLPHFLTLEPVEKMKCSRCHDCYCYFLSRPPALKWYRAKCNIQAEIEEMQEEQRSLSSLETLSVWRLLMDDSVRWQVLSVVVINIGMQLSGIDAVSTSTQCAHVVEPESFSIEMGNVSVKSPVCILWVSDPENCRKNFSLMK